MPADLPSLDSARAITAHRLEMSIDDFRLAQYAQIGDGVHVYYGRRRRRR
jgi:hypothetical protein